MTGINTTLASNAHAKNADMQAVLGGAHEQCTNTLRVTDQQDMCKGPRYYQSDRDFQAVSGGAHGGGGGEEEGKGVYLHFHCFDS